MTSSPVQAARPRPTPDPEGRSFIEVQFPVSRLSKESYKERKAVAGQTLTGLGKWWGRKPLVLVRALILGLLLPATDDPEGDREVFLALMTMDDDGLWQRMTKSIPAGVVHAMALPREREQYFQTDGGKVAWRRGLSADERRSMQRRAFFRMSYDDKLVYCVRPEEIDGPDLLAWGRINAHLGTSATSLPQLVRELGERRFGHNPRVGDAFCGGGSIPFEAARIGCDAYASDLNPVAALLTWGALNVVGGGEAVVRRVADAQRRVFEAVQRQVDEWGIERNEDGWVADAYLYCNEVVDPHTGWMVPLAPSWIIATKTNVIARLVPDPARKRFEIEIVERVTPQELADAALEGTAAGGVRCPVDADGRWIAPALRQATSFEALRGRQGLRRWENDDLVPRPGDVFQERLYCIRWVDPRTGARAYRAPTEADLRREERVLELLRERFHHWQSAGYIPSRRIEPGDKTAEPIRTRGWTHWHHLFNPRQLLVNGLFAEHAAEERSLEAKALLLMQGRLADANGRLSRWQVGQGGGIGGGKTTFDNQAINTLFNFNCRPIASLKSAYLVPIKGLHLDGSGDLELLDARSVSTTCSIWITDPGYADAINYEELSEYFLAWYDKRVTESFPSWYSDSRRALAVTGTGEQFRVTLAGCYKRMASNMTDDGFQVVMFTHQDPSIWSDLALVLWSAGLQVTTAWTIQTETPSTGIKGGAGNFVQGTVCLVLRKRQGERFGDLADLYPDIQTEVERQLQSMLALDDKDEPNFGDADYQLAAYAAALRVLTGYSQIGDIDVERELRRQRGRNERSPLAPLIEQAVKIASDVLVPEGLDRATWRGLGPDERLYLKGIDVESGGEAREGVYQELARGYGAAAYRDLLASRAANATRLKTPSEFAGRDLRAASGFGATLLRQVLYAIHATASDPERSPRPARDYLRRELPDYWSKRATIVELLRYLSTRPSGLPHWAADAHAARLLLGSVESDTM
jgi:putative DNA methylase